METTKDIIKHIDEYAEKLELIYRLLGWKWVNEVVKKEEIKDKILGYIIELQDSKNACIESGGIKVSKEKWCGKTMFHVQFIYELSSPLEEEKT
jgi:hypothetical protein